MVNGITDFYYKQSSNPFSMAIINEVFKTTGLKNNGTRFEDLCVLRNNLQPSKLIELGFVPNKQDDSVIESSNYRENVAQGIYLGLLDYFSIKNK
jgi:N-acetylmuramoyl-L-alanine amidase